MLMVDPILQRRFNPRRDVPGLALWYDFGDIASLALDTSSSRLSISQANDLSGFDNHATQAVKNSQPTLTPEGCRGRFVATGDGSAYRFDVPAASVSGLAAATVLLSVKVNADPPGVSNSTGFWNFGSAQTGSSSHFPWTDGTIYDEFGSTTRKTTVNPTPSLTTPRIYSVRSAASAWDSHLDGVQIYSTGTNTVGWHSAITLMSSGDDVGASRYHMNGFIGEFLIFDSYLNHGQMNAVGQYLAQKWGCGWIGLSA